MAFKSGFSHLRLLGLVTLLMLGSTVMMSAPVSAQDAAPCELEPVSVPLWDATPPAVIAATPVEAPAESPTEDDVLPSIEQIFACSNSGNPALMFAVFTPRFLAEQVTEESGNYLPGLEQIVSVDVAIEQADELVLDEISEFSVLDDGRVQVTINYHNATEAFEDTLVLAKVGEYWLIDGVESLDPVQPGS